MAYETAVLMQLGARTAKHPIRMGGFSPHIRLTDYDTFDRNRCNLLRKMIYLKHF